MADNMERNLAQSVALKKIPLSRPMKKIPLKRMHPISRGV